MIKICMGSSCFSRGNREHIDLIRNFLSENNLNTKIEMRGAHCHDLCKNGPLIMIDNIDKTLKRDEKISDIETKSEELQDGSKRFKKVSTKLKQKLFCKNMKFMLILFAIIIIFILIIVIITLKK